MEAVPGNHWYHDTIAYEDSALGIMAKELWNLVAVFTAYGAMRRKETRDIVATPFEDLFFGELASDAALRAGGSAITFKPSRHYQELVAAARLGADQLEAGIIDADRLATHDGEVGGAAA